jgi:hypothetical protein
LFGNGRLVDSLFVHGSFSYAVPFGYSLYYSLAANDQPSAEVAMQAAEGQSFTASSPIPSDMRRTLILYALLDICIVVARDARTTPFGASAAHT